MNSYKSIQKVLLLLTLSIGIGIPAVAEQVSPVTVESKIYRFDRETYGLTTTHDRNFMLDKEAKILTPKGNTASIFSLEPGTKVRLYIDTSRQHQGMDVVYKVELLR